MKKEKAADLFGSMVLLSRALNISPAAVSQWPQVLTTRQQDEVIGAAIRLNKITPERAKELIDEGQRDERSQSAPD